MTVRQDGVERNALPDCARCVKDVQKRNPLVIDECLGTKNVIVIARITRRIGNEHGK